MLLILSDIHFQSEKVFMWIVIQQILPLTSHHDLTFTTMPFEPQVKQTEKQNCKAMALNDYIPFKVEGESGGK